jgi:hypothetical protein
MKLAGVAILFLMIGAGCAQRASAPAREPVTAHREQVTTRTAIVEDIDQKTRMVTLRAADGHTFRFRAGEEVENLPQVKKGDRVVAKYYEGIVAEVREPTKEERENPKAIVQGTGSAPLGERPATARSRSVRTVATVTAIDRATQNVTFRGPGGEAFTVKARDPEKLAAVKVGDTVVLTYTEAVGISVETGAAK